MTCRAACVFWIGAALCGCQSGYVIEQSYDHLILSSRQIPLDSPHLVEVLAAESLQQVRRVPDLLSFCRKELGLDPGDSYTTFLDTGGKPVSYVVTASHPLALIPYQWHFPFAGTVPYKGYFDRDDALSEERQLREEGWETAVLPVAAFSTLGWFRDPVLPSMLEGGPAGLADILIHELTHRTVYFTANGNFNESLATHIAREGTVRYLWSREELRGLLPGYLAAVRRRMQRERLLTRLENDLNSLYRSARSDAEKRRRKKEIFRSASAAYRILAPRAGGGLPASNAEFVSHTTYHGYARLLVRLQEALGGNPSDVVAYLKQLPEGDDPVPAIQRRLAASHRASARLGRAAPAPASSS